MVKSVGWNKTQSNKCPELTGGIGIQCRCKLKLKGQFNDVRHCISLTLKTWNLDIPVSQSANLDRGLLRFNKNRITYFGKDTLEMGKEKIVENLNLSSNPRRKTP